MRGRYRRPFTIYSRKDKNGKKIQYVRLYADDGYTRFSFSTGQRSKEAAFVKYCGMLSDPNEIKRLQKEYSLRKALSEKKKSASSQARKHSFAYSDTMLFKDYAKDWWDWDKCPYVKAKRNRGTENHPGIKKGAYQLPNE